MFPIISNGTSAWRDRRFCAWRTESESAALVVISQCRKPVSVSLSLSLLLFVYLSLVSRYRRHGTSIARRFRRNVPPAGGEICRICYSRVKQNRDRLVPPLVPDFSHERPRGIPAGRKSGKKEGRKRDGRNPFDGNTDSARAVTAFSQLVRLYCISTLRRASIALHLHSQQRFAGGSPPPPPRE